MSAEIPDTVADDAAAIAATLPGWDSPLSLAHGGPGLVASRLIALKRVLRPVPKERDFKGSNQNGLTVVKYQFRGIDDVYNALHEAMGVIGLVLIPEETRDVKRAQYETSRGGRANHVAVVIKYKWLAEDGSFQYVELPGEGMDHGDKATGKALSMSQKYGLVQSLGIPTGEPDGDEFQTEGTPAVRPAGPAARAQHAPDQAPAAGGPAPAAPLTAPQRVPFTDADQARRTIDAMADPSERGGLTRRLHDSLNAGTISPVEANTLMARMEDRTKGIRA